jgi:nucleotide-binding universal stress UspA family protein
MPWLPKHTVVVPIDFSPESLAALNSALELVEDASHLYAVHVLPDLLDAPGIMWETVSDQSRKEEVERELRQRVTDPKFARLKTNVFIGDPGLEITAFAERLKADLIVIPSHGRTGLKRLLMGSVAERVVRLAHCPVLVLRS